MRLSSGRRKKRRCVLCMTKKLHAVTAQMCIYILHSFLCAFGVVRLLQRWVYQRSLRTIGGWISDAMLGCIRAAVAPALVATQCMGLGQSSGAAFSEEFQRRPRLYSLTA